MLALIFSGVSVVGTIVIGMITAKTNVKVSKINNLEAVHKFEKKITKFELQFRDELWLAEILENGEFGRYDAKSQKRILKWWLRYQEEHPVLLLNPIVEYKHRELLAMSKSGLLKNVKTEPMPGTEPDPKDLF